jgi:hypothetical protein
MLEPLTRAETRYFVEGFSVLLAHPDPEIRRGGAWALEALLNLGQWPVERKPLRERFPPQGFREAARRGPGAA